MTWEELLDEYFLARILRPKTQDSYRQAVKQLKKHIELQPDEIEHRNILFWRKDVLGNGLSNISFNNYARHLRALFNFAIDQGLVPHTENPFHKLNVRTPVRAKKTLSPFQINMARNLLSEMQERETHTGKRETVHPAWFWRVVFETFYHSAIRLNQLLHLRMKDIVMRSNYLLIIAEGSKTWREYPVPIVDQLTPWLELLLRHAVALNFTPDEQLFNVNRFSAYHRSKYMNSNQVERVFQRMSHNLGFKVSPHRFRHTLATDMMKHPDRNLHTTQKLLGHTDVRTTLEYVSPDLEMLREAVSKRGG